MEKDIRATLIITHTHVDESLVQKYIAASYVSNNNSRVFNFDKTIKEVDQNWDFLQNNQRVISKKYASKDDFKSSILNIYSEYPQRTLLFLGNLDSYSVQLQEGLLRLIEEPPKNLHVIILAHNTSSVLPTILSRSQIYVLDIENVYVCLDQTLLSRVKKMLPSPESTVKNILSQNSVSIDNLSKIERKEIGFWLWQLQIYLEKYYEHSPTEIIAHSIRKILMAQYYNNNRMLKRLVVETISCR